MNKHKKIQKFKTASEEAIFWDKHDTADYVDWSK